MENAGSDIRIAVAIVIVAAAILLLRWRSLHRQGKRQDTGDNKAPRCFFFRKERKKQQKRKPSDAYDDFRIVEKTIVVHTDEYIGK